MRYLLPVTAFAMAMSAPVAAAPAASVAQMRWHQRIVLLFAPDDTGPARQRAILAAWREQAAARDLVIVTVVGDRVTGASDRAATLRRRFAPGAGFTAILIGKDGGEKLRVTEPFTTATLARTIDAMPMRRDEAR